MAVKVNPEFRYRIEENTHADLNMCWTCSSCDLECPMNIATNRLRPQKMVHMAHIGLYDELIHSPEIWYCLTCRRCNHICPNSVKPADVIAFGRHEALRTGIISHSRVRTYYELFTKFQRVRWHVAKHCLSGMYQRIDDTQFATLLETPVPESTGALSNRYLFKSDYGFIHTVASAKGSSCFTCGECCSACPISGSRSVFDPRFIFRMSNLGLVHDLLRSPSIWLCLDCGRCTEACSQLVDGRQLIRNIQRNAIQSGMVPKDIMSKVRNANAEIYSMFVEKVDQVLWGSVHQMSA